MKTLNLAVLALISVVLVNCKDGKKEDKTVDDTMTTDMTSDTDMEMEEEVEEKILEITLEPKSESDVKGTVRFTEAEGIVSMEAKITGLSEGQHAIHLHEKADCSSADGKSTGGHWNPTAEPHGKWGAESGYHKGDIGNFNANAQGEGTITFATNEWCIGCDDDQKNIVGKAVIVHQGTDDFTSQPSGAAGTRISCAAVIQ
ncbi:superoxide dismutase family protein [Aquimarina intermedia]|uniref:Cu-Zn family superoxide dismutase n=1 Tax=Aquimarina intermedia TaxID=350814 RepID=A0A5S5C2C7_9FLAO|nr:superoxide dismutase family protein [Aquimarina intermedia]TYP72758.1 Cu-Zn family superoxide dismutase [Aquimarina intermedia]